MRQLLIILTLIAAIVCACNSSEHVRTASTSKLIPESGIVEQLKYKKASIDTLFNHNKDSIEILMKLTDQDKLIPFKDSILPDETETLFYILRDSLKRIIGITESPYSQSGDWYITLTHYFDNNGQTFAFERRTNFFNSGCTEGVAYEIKTEYYNSNFKLVDKDYKLVDEKGRDLIKDSCTFLYEYAYKVCPNLDSCLQVDHIQRYR